MASTVGADDQLRETASHPEHATEPLRYAAFVSYSSKDEKFARRLHRVLEAYSIPRSLGEFDVIGSGKKNRIYPVFRDREELPAGELGAAIEAALRASSALIVVCSPHAATSPWVDKEIAYFLRLGRRDRIFAIIADNVATQVEGRDVTQDSFPPTFRRDEFFGFEPIAADGRRGRDGFRNSWLKVVAGLIGENAGALQDRDRKRRARQRVQSAFAMVALLGLALTGLLTTARLLADNNQRASNALAELARVANDNGLTDRAARYAIAGINTFDAPFVSYDPAAARAELARASMGEKTLLVLSGHVGPINDAVFSPDGSRVLTGSDDSTARLWDASTGALIRTFEGHASEIYSAAFSPDGTKVVTASYDWSARVWDVSTGRELLAVRAPGPLAGAAFSPDGSQILVRAGLVPLALIFDAATGVEVAKLRLDAGVMRRAEYSPDGKWVLTVGRSEVRVWESRTGRLAATSPGQSEEILSAHFSADSTHVLTGSADKTVREWAYKTGQQRTLLRADTDVVSAEYSPDQSRFLTVFRDPAAGVFQVENGRARVSMASTGSYVFDLAIDDAKITRANFDQTGAKILTLSDDNAVRIWDSATGHEVMKLSGHAGEITSAHFSNDGRRVLTGSEDHTARVWDAVDATTQVLAGHRDAINASGLSPEGARLVTASKDEVLSIWDFSSGRLLTSQKAPGVASIKFRSDGKAFASLSASRIDVWSDAGQRIGNFSVAANDKLEHISDDLLRVVTINNALGRIWDVATGKETARLQGQISPLTAAAFSPDGLMVATASEDGAVALWDSRNGSPNGKLRGHEGPVRSVSFSPDGARLATVGDDSTVRVWNLADGKQIALMALDPNVSWRTDGGYPPPIRVAFDPGGRFVVTTRLGDTSARIWDASSGKSIAALRAAQARDVAQVGVESARFSRTGRLIITRDELGARIWDARSWRQIATFPDHDGSMTDANISPDDGKLVATFRDGSLSAFDISLATADANRLRASTCEGALRGERSRLTESELAAAPMLDGAVDRDVCHALPPLENLRAAVKLPRR
jgi:WD40 repeat protein